MITKSVLNEFGDTSDPNFLFYGVLQTRRLTNYFMVYQPFFVTLNHFVFINNYELKNVNFDGRSDRSEVRLEHSCSETLRKFT